MHACAQTHEMQRLVRLKYYQAGELGQPGTKREAHELLEKNRMPIHPSISPGERPRFV
jgi:hypothetical protein